MTTVALSVFRPYVQPEVLGCPLVMVDDAIRDAARRFSEDTWIVRADLTSFPTVSTTQNYTLSPPTGHEVLSVKTVILDGKGAPLTPAPENASLRYVQTPGAPTHFWFQEGALWFYPTPNAVFQVAVNAIIRPTTTTTVVDSRYEEYREAVASRAKYKLMSMKGVAWADPGAAQFHYALYSQLSNEQQVKDGTGRASSSLRVQTNFF